jgi:predicted deacylase
MCSAFAQTEEVWYLSGNKRAFRNTLILILIALAAAAIGLAAGVMVVSSVRDPAPQMTLAPSVVPPPTATASLQTMPPPTAVVQAGATVQNTPVTPSATISPTPEPQPPTPTPAPFFEGPFAYGTSVEGRPLLAYRLGTGSSARAIIGAIHGGYEWNTTVLVSETLKHLQGNPALVPENVTLYIIPCANPDGYAASRSLDGRPNSNGVDLNRNWDYQWQPTATHGTRPVSAGTHPFSEPETAALRDLILEQGIEAAIFYHSAMAQVFHGAETDLSATYELAVAVSEATGYPVAAGVYGQITTGDAIDWMSVQGLAGVEVELTNHQDIEWERNLRGLLAFLNWSPPASLANHAVQTFQIGNSAQNRSIEVTQIGNGSQIALVIIGSIHGDETNTQELVRSLMEQYIDDPELVPSEFTVYFAPTINPDGLALGTRQNANGVDLNRNWPTDDWQADAARTSGIIPGSGGTEPGSELEVQAASDWLLNTVKPAVQTVWLLSYHSPYPPDGGVQPGYTSYGTPGPQADELAQRAAEATGYTYLSTWISEFPFTGELIHWCDLNGIWAVDVELPSHDPPDTVPSGRSETTLATHQRLLSTLLADSRAYRPSPGEDGLVRHTVQPEDTLLGIAIQYDVEMDEIMLLNEIEDENLIAIGQVLLIPAATGD